MIIKKLTVISGIFLFLISCEPYTPTQMEQPVISADTAKTSGITSKVYSLIGQKQTCNPSISQDTVNFGGCMMWLNFSGDLPVEVAPEVTGFDKKATQHDRITITDTGNVVRWFLPIKSIATESEEFQDPEWSTHPSYIDFLVSSEYKSKWSCFAVNLPTKDTLRLCNEKMGETSTPHLWVDKSSVRSNEVLSDINYDSTSGIVDRETVKKFFGTYNVKLTYALKENGILSLYYVDFSKGNQAVKLQKPADKRNWDFESPLISPDGKWIVFNAYEITSFYESYIQELSPTSLPILIESNAADPHWWSHPDDPSKLYIIYTSIPGSNLVMSDLSDESLLKDGSAGQTYMAQVECFAGKPSIFSFNIISQKLIINLPLKGGLSPDGKFLCTGSDKAYIVRLY